MALSDGIESIAVTATGVLGSAKREASDKLTGYACAQLYSSAISATVKCQGTNDGTNWVDLLIVNMSDGTTASSITANGMYRADVGGCHWFRWYCSGFASATAAYLTPQVREG